MESLHSFLRRHWDDEPLDVPRRTERAYKSDALQTLRARSRVRGRRVSVWSACVFSAAFPRQGGTRCLGRIMESPHDFDAVHWDHEPLALPRRTESADKSDALQTLRACGRVRGRRVSVWSACVFSAAFPRQAAIRWPDRSRKVSACEGGLVRPSRASRAPPSGITDRRKLAQKVHLLATSF